MLEQNEHPSFIFGRKVKVLFFIFSIFLLTSVTVYAQQFVNGDFEMGDYSVILASTSDTSGAYLCANSDWLWDRLDHYQTKKGVFVFMHITPKKWTDNGVDCPEILNTLESHPNVLAVFQGHDHNESGLRVSNGIPYYFDGHFGGAWGTAYRGYRIVEVKKDGPVLTYEYNMDSSLVMNENLQHLAFLKKGELAFLPSEKFAHDGQTLTDGVFGTINFRDGKWAGFEGTDFEWTLNLGQMSTLHEISAGFLVNKSSLIFPPESIEFLISLDGKHFKRVFLKDNSKNDLSEPISIQRYMMSLKETPCRFVKVKALHQTELPENTPGKDKKSWLMVDEIVIK